VIYKQNSDHSLEGGLRSLRVKRSLSQLAAPWDDGDTSYFRGAYVMRMLENEVGADKVRAGLKALITERRGKGTAWADLRPIFEKSAGVPLDWFWDQWVDGATFPQLDITKAIVLDWNGKRQARVTVRQSGTPRLYRLRFKVVVSNGPRMAEQVVTMRSPEAVFDLPVDFVPGQAKIDVFGYALATVGGATSFTSN
jgi:aminopeptidase N